MRIPIEWSHMHAGDRIHTTIPLHRIKAAIQSLKREGWKFDTEPSPRGYWLLCRESPLKSPYVSDPAT